MSFAGTPLGQGRRLDHSAFLGKPPSTGSLAPSSYSYGAPALGSRSPPKNASPARDTQDHNENDDDEPALSRFARIKQREATRDFSNRPGGPRVITSPPKPDKWTVKDTSVNIATAFTQAAAGEDMSTNYNSNNAWASTSRTSLPVPRSTSVEYEAAAPQATNRRLPPPPDKLNRSTVPARKPLSKTTSLRHVPDSEGEEEHSSLNVRGRSPFEQGLSLAKQALGAAAYYVRQRSREPEELSMERPQPPVNGSANGNDSSYDYVAEEQAFQAHKRSTAAARRNRMSVDNKAYKPPQDSEGESEWSDGGKTKRRKRKFKKGPAGGPLSTLPVVSADKRRRRKSHGSTGNIFEEDDESESEENTQADTLQSNNLGFSLPNTRVLPSRLSQEPSQHDLDDSMLSAEQGLQSIPEVDEDSLPTTVAVSAAQQHHVPSQPRRAGSRPRSRSRTPASHGPLSGFSIGSLLGSIVHISVKLTLWLFSGILSFLSMVTFICGQVFGTTYDLILRRPAGWARGAGPWVKYLVPALVIVLAWYVLHDASLSAYLPSLSRPSRYLAPDVPPADLAELADRLLRIENALSGLSHDTERAKVKTEDGAKNFYELQNRLSSLEGKIIVETRKVQEAEVRARDSFSRSIHDVKQDVEVLQSQLSAQRKQQEKDGNQKAAGDASDKEARSRLKALEERVVSVEGGVGGVKDALEQLAKKPTTSSSSPTPGTAPAWWHKLTSGIGVIKSADGQDVTVVISQLVHSAVSTLSKDMIAKPDFALHSGGARVIPSLTSPTLEIRPKGFPRQLYGLITGSGYALGRPPVTALHHELHNGHCWPFAGQEGQLGVVLAAPTLVEEVTIDHLAREVVYDVRSAPRQMEVWGMVDGKDNIERLKVWKEVRQSTDGAHVDFDGVIYPKTLPKVPEYVRLANFTYDIHAADHVQTFTVDPEIRSLGVDFGVVVLRVLNNWGMDEFTCLYRFRVHGQRLGGVPVPYGEAVDEEQSS